VSGTNYIGVNSSNVNDGTPYVIDGVDKSFNLFDITVMDLGWLENFELKNGLHGLDFADGADSWLMNNVFIHDCVNGTDLGRQQMYFHCTFSNCENGVFRPADSLFVHCVAHTCNGHGFEIYQRNSVVGCLSYDNAVGYRVSSRDQSVNYNLVADGNGVNYELDSHSPVLIGVRATDAGTIDIDSNTATGRIFLAYIEAASVDGAYKPLLYNGVEFLTASGADANGGYENQAGKDFNLASGATYRSVGFRVGAPQGT
jgi:hypothetical protein